MANAFKSVFGAEVDRFLVGKLIFGFLAIVSLLTSSINLLRAGMASAGTTATSSPVSSLLEVGIWSAISAVVWIVAFFCVERARQRAAH